VAIVARVGRLDDERVAARRGDEFAGDDVLDGVRAARFGGRQIVRAHLDAEGFEFGGKLCHFRF